ncbi:tetratricopeptide repeat protein [Scytonema sp. UIC 10036]|uniref:tetratricopeptide repeat protein n=1 Tax=Scytonema sp. UIC 10036 TaxID=2304196 RepID=UPI0012DA9595|nr:tetratricopeptide repeat protein [Scytonema sp. UIC 10036]MUG94502.1 tetratricopeptide repeat protein [Scytonema sp. UIC 10036]
MNRFSRFILGFSMTVALACFFLTSPTHSSPVLNAQITASDFFRLGVEKMQHGNYQAAVEDFTQAIGQKKDFVAAYSNRCLANIQIFDYHNAIADCDRAIKNAPHLAEAYVNQGLAHYRLGDYPSAIADNNTALTLKPYDFRAYYNRGVANAVLGNHVQAIADYNLALSQIPPYPSAPLADIYNDRGIAHLELQDLLAAKRDFSVAIRLNPKDYRVYFNRGCVYGRSGDNLSAIRDFTESLKLHPANAHAYFNRGIAYHQIGYEQAAIADLHYAAQYFASFGEIASYEKTLALIKNLEQQLSSMSEIALL